MASTLYNEKSVEELIDESSKYLMLYKAEINKNKKIKAPYNNFEATVGILRTTIAEKENEIKSLKQKNIKCLIDIGGYTSRNNLLMNEKKKLEKEIDDLTLKLKESETQYQTQIDKYNELNNKFLKAEEIHIQNFRVFIREYSMYIDENTALKQQLAKEKESVSQLQTYLQYSNDVIYNMYEHSKHLYTLF